MLVPWKYFYRLFPIVKAIQENVNQILAYSNDLYLATDFYNLVPLALIAFVF